jgi:hypothetical protein
MSYLTTIRQSQMNTLLRCPAQFEFRYIKGLYIPPGIAAHRGTAIHRPAQANSLHKLDCGEDLPLDYLTDMAADSFKYSVEEKGVFVPKSQVSGARNLLGEAKDQAVRLTRLFRQEVAPTFWPKLVEERMIVDLGVGAPIEGTLDLVTMKEQVWDYKSAAKSYNPDQAHKSLQLTFYAVLYKLKYGRWPEELTLVVLVDTKTPKVQPLPTRRNEAHLPAFADRLKLALKQVNLGLFPPCDPTNWWCSEAWCGYWHICKYAPKTL